MTIGTLPTAFSPDGESHRWLAAFKRARGSKWSFRSSRSLWDMSDLCTYLLALKRWPEVASIGEEVGRQLSYSGDHDIWSPVRSTLCHAGYAYHAVNNRRDELRMYDVALGPGQVLPSLREHSQMAAEGRATIEGAKIDASGRLAVLTRLRHVFEDLALVRFQFPGASWLPESELEEQARMGLGKLLLILG